MLLKCKCPHCGQPKDYIDEQVGQPAYCSRCGQSFTLQAQPAKVAWHLAVATFVVLAGVLGFLGKMYSKAHKYDRARPPAFTSVIDDDDDK